ncbi:Glycerol-3-phosphate regulon repressor GlpR [Amycolatopsis camponoti]|uniref:Glycerol-3-phosphate regulon repressor GlpR n=1 Tax=Amycolatopsis camponoti TaxID=2606593 RepID=A0A6I8LG15_9PSEU|nr:DeoR/GlpR family DNA-binding transcription regulator [Amycolatopsis camponoti]VVJ16394.1 Glycerol-3-phosphate regulon repressor GlpR [Amycolatopsis camponoti]
MDRHERLSALLDMVGQREKIDVEASAEELDVSAATIRRDLDHLAGRRLLTRTRGGAVASNVAYDLPLRHKAARKAPEKQRISAAAARLVERGMVLGLNGGTTSTEVARALVLRPELAQQRDSSPALTVVTNALNIAHELAVRPNIKIVVTGGVARQHSFELTGPLASLFLDQITLDLVFLGVDAFDAERGAFAHHEGEASINRLLASRARQVTVIADGGKLGGHAFARICDTTAVDQLITDAGAAPDQVTAFEAAGVEVLLA